MVEISTSCRRRRARRAVSAVAVGTFALVVLARPFNSASTEESADNVTDTGGGGVTAQRFVPPIDTSDLILEDVSGAVILRDGATRQASAVVRNRGGGTVDDVVMRFKLGDDVVFDRATSSAGCELNVGQVICPVGSLGSGESRTVTVGLSVPSPGAAVGARDSYFLAPVSQLADLNAGEIRERSWALGYGITGSPLLSCWALDARSPNMASPSSGCGTSGSPPLDPNSERVLERFSDAMRSSAVGSYEWLTEITPATSGTYKVCAAGLGDAAYVAVGPTTSALVNDDVVYELDGYDSEARQRTFDLDQGVSYRVLARLSTHRYDPTTGAADIGWDYLGITLADRPCTQASAGVFGTADAGWQQRYPAAVEVIQRPPWNVVGFIESASSDAATISVRLQTPSATQAADSVELSGATDGAGEDGTSCAAAEPGDAVACRLPPAAADDTTVVEFRAPRASPGRSLFLSASNAERATVLTWR